MQTVFRAASINFNLRAVRRRVMRTLKFSFAIAGGPRSWFLVQLGVFAKYVAAGAMFVCAFNLAQSAKGGEKPTSANAYATKFFLDKPPTAADLARVPADAHDVIVAKVRIINIGGTRGRHGEIYSRHTEANWAEIKIVDVLSGSTEKNAKLVVYFGIWGSPRLTYPLPGHARSLAYFIVAYLNSINDLELLGFPSSQEEYASWQNELHNYFRNQLHRGMKNR